MNKQYPKISIITPSYNQGQFLEQTILSVIGQNYPNLEYIIMDGGSIDNSIEIIKKYEKYITYWVSEKDGGQSEAINKGFAKATGDILAWLNSDDYYLPNTLFYVAQNLNLDTPTILCGNCMHIFEDSNRLLGSEVDTRNRTMKLQYIDYVIQPSTFWNKLTWQKVGQLSQNLHYVFDWEWFLKAKVSEVVFQSTKNYLSVYRIHKDHKSGSGDAKRTTEIYNLYKEHASPDIANLFMYLYNNREKIDKMKNMLNRFMPERVQQILIRRVFFPYLSKFEFKTVHQVALMT